MKVINVRARKREQCVYHGRMTYTLSVCFCHLYRHILTSVERCDEVMSEQIKRSEYCHSKEWRENVKFGMVWCRRLALATCTQAIISNQLLFVNSLCGHSQQQRQPERLTIQIDSTFNCVYPSQCVSAHKLFAVTFMVLPITRIMRK